MAIYHLSFKAVSRAKGHSAVSKSAYRAAEKLHDQRLDKTFDFSKKSDVFYKEIISPDNKPEFLDALGIRDHLSMNRSNGLTSMIKQIQMYALVFKTMESSDANTAT